MATKTKTSTFTDRLEEAEKASLEAADASRKALEDSRVNVDRYRELVDDSEIILRDLEGRLTKGDETVTVQALIEADAAFKRATFLNEGTTKAVARAAKGLLGPAKDLASTVLPVLEKALPGVPALATFAKLSAFGNASEAPTLAETPVAIVMQDKPSEGEDGRLAGKVTVFYYHSQVQRELSERGLQEAAESTDDVFLTVHVDQVGMDKGEGVLLDVARLSISQAIAEVPIIAKVNEGSLSPLLGGWAADFAGTGGGKVKFSSQNGTYSSNTITATPIHSKIVSQNVSNSGTRIVKVELALSYVGHASKAEKAYSNIFEGIAGPASGSSKSPADLVAEYVGDFVPGLGRVTEAKVTKNERSDHGPSVLKVELALVSKS